MAENLGQSHEIVASVHKELVGHRVPQQVRVQLHTDQDSVLAAQVPNPSIGERTSFANEDQSALHRRASFQIGLQRSTCRKRKRNRPLLVPLTESVDHRATAIAEHQVFEFQGDEIANTSGREQEQMEDGVGPDVARKLNFPQQLPYLGMVQALRANCCRFNLLQRPFLSLVAQFASLYLMNGNHEQASLFNFRQRDELHDVAVGGSDRSEQVLPEARYRFPWLALVLEKLAARIPCKIP